jgi:ADP-heptose:LPS heptosyltransferase
MPALQRRVSRGSFERRVGIPLVLLLTLARTIRQMYRKQTPVPPLRLLFIELSETGAAILADPAMKKARDRLEAELFFVIGKRNREVLSLLGTVRPAHIFTIRESNLFLLALDSLRVLFWSRRNKIDTVIDLEVSSRFTALLAGLCGAVNRVGFFRFCSEGLYRGDLLTHRVLFNPHIHIARNFVALVNSLLAAEDERPYSKQVVTDGEVELPVVGYHETELANMHEMVRRHYPRYERGRHRLVLINPHAGEMLPQRRWPPERFVELMQRILGADPEVLVLITGAGAEHDETATMRSRVGVDRCLNFAGAVALDQLPVLCTIAVLMVSCDSGPSHFSAITNLPTFVLFGPETPTLYGSLGNSTPIFAGLACSPCVSAATNRGTVCRDNKCLQAITVDQVFAAITPTLLPGKESGQIQ